MKLKRIFSAAVAAALCVPTVLGGGSVINFTGTVAYAEDSAAYVEWDFESWSSLATYSDATYATDNTSDSSDDYYAKPTSDENSIGATVNFYLSGNSTATSVKKIALQTTSNISSSYTTTATTIKGSTLTFSSTSKGIKPSTSQSLVINTGLKNSGYDYCDVQIIFASNKTTDPYTAWLRYSSESNSVFGNAKAIYCREEKTDDDGNVTEAIGETDEAKQIADATETGLTDETLTLKFNNQPFIYYIGIKYYNAAADPSVTLLDPNMTTSYTLDGTITTVTTGAEDLSELPTTLMTTGYTVSDLPDGTTITDSTINVVYGAKAYALNPTDSTVKAWISDNGMAIMQAFGDVITESDTGLPAVAKAVVAVSDGETTETLETDATVEFVTWDFVNSGTINSQYSAGEFTSSGVTLAYDTTNGKLNNESGNGWCQFNAGTTLTVPVFEGSTISWTLYSTDHKIKIGDTEYSSTDTYTATETGTVTLESVGGDGVQCYISTLVVTY